jgi:hypothetical protein
VEFLHGYINFDDTELCPYCFLMVGFFQGTSLFVQNGSSIHVNLLVCIMITITKLEKFVAEFYIILFNNTFPEFIYINQAVIIRSEAHLKVNKI